MAAVAALSSVAGEITVCVRSRSRASAVAQVADRLGVPLAFCSWDAIAAHLDAPLVVSTTPAGITDQLAASVPPDPGLLFDVVYDPWPTALGAAWHAAGGAVLGGLDLLVHQAVGQVQLMTGSSVPVSVLRDALAHT